MVGEQTTISDGKTTWILMPKLGMTSKVDLAKLKAALPAVREVHAV